MRNAYLAAIIALFLFSIGYCSIKHKKPVQAKQGLPEYIIPLYKVPRHDSPTGFIWCALPEYVFEKKTDSVFNFMAKFPDSLQRYKECTIRLFSIGCCDKQAAKELAQTGFLLFNPQMRK